MKSPDRADRVIGVLGGMGPEATVDLFAKILQATPIRREQDHLRILIDSNPKIPDRTAAILSGRTQAVVTCLVDGARNLQRAGADLIVMPCNTAHFFIAQVQAAVSIPVVNMVEETVCALEAAVRAVRCVGVLATTGTMRTGVYARALSARGIRSLEPDPEDQQVVMNAIMAIKAKEDPAPAAAALRRVAMRLVEGGAQGIIGGCTEVPLALSQKDLQVPFFDSTWILALAAVRWAKGEVPGAGQIAD